MSHYHNQKKSWPKLAERIFAVALTAAIVPWVSALAQDITPGGGTSRAAGSECSVQWDGSRFDGTVSISLWNGEAGTWQAIASGVPAAQGVISWNIPASLSGERFRIKVTDASTGAYEMSRGYFTIGKSSGAAAVTAGNAESARITLNARLIPDIGELHISPGDVDGAGLWLFNVAGDMVRSTEVRDGNDVVLDVADLPSGLYIVRVEDRTGRTGHAKVMIAR